MTRRAALLLPLASMRVDATEEKDKTPEMFDDFYKQLTVWAKLYDRADPRTLSWPEVTAWKSAKKLWKRFENHIDREYEEGR